VNSVAQDPAPRDLRRDLHGSSTRPTWFFDETYRFDWGARISQWKTSAELRLCCNCTKASFVEDLQPDHQKSIGDSCPACSKLWCMRCGDPIGPSAPSLGPVSNHTGPTYCKNTWAIEEAAPRKLDTLAFSRALPLHCIPAHFLRPCSVVPRSTTCSRSAPVSRCRLISPSATRSRMPTSAPLSDTTSKTLILLSIYPDRPGQNKRMAMIGDSLIQTILVRDWFPTGDIQNPDARNHDRSAQEEV
jgi:hypothetical protein